MYIYLRIFRIFSDTIVALSVKLLLSPSSLRLHSNSWADFRFAPSLEHAK